MNDASLRRETVARLVRRPYSLELFHWRVTIERQVRQRFKEVLPDISHFHAQTTALDANAIPQFIAFFRNGRTEQFLPVLVKVPDLANLRAAYDQLLGALADSNLRLEKVDHQEAEEIFVDRMFEFLLAQSAARDGETIVHSNRSGDTVLCAKGYFTSTGTAFGISTPATGVLRGTYSFGINDSGRQRFDNTLWSCPATVRLDMP